jgi:hypothetical protein
MNIRIRWLLALALIPCLGARAEVPPAHKLLPRDTILVVTAPDGAKAWAALTNRPSSKFWADPAMKPFRDKFTAKFSDEILAPLERTFGFKPSDYKGMLEGQVTFALVPFTLPDKPEAQMARVLLIDTKSHADQLKKNLAVIKKKWTDAEKPMKSTKIRDVEFTTYIASSSDLPWPEIFPTAKSFLPAEEEAQPQAKPPPEKINLSVGQSDSLLLVSDSEQALEKILSRQAGSSVPALEESAAFQKNYASRLHDAPIYGWANVKTALELWLKKPANPDAGGPDLTGITSTLDMLGVGNITSASFAYRENPDGTTFQFFIDAPEDTRRGILKALAFQPKDSSPPPFVPADVVRFFRLRLDLPKTWGILEAMIGEINPMAARTINFILQTAGKDKDENYDLKAQLLSNLGDDFISYQRAPAQNTMAGLKSLPAVYLLGSPNPEKLAQALKVAMGVLAQGSSNIKDREFLGRKIYSLPSPAGDGFSFAASGNYLVMSGDVQMLEEYLRSGENKHKSLSETAGLSDAIQRVGGSATGLFGYSNEREMSRAALEAYRKGPVTMADFFGTPGIAQSKAKPDDGKKLKEWADFSLLPSFDEVSKYFYFSVYSGRFTPEGFSITFFAPTPPTLH